MAERDSEDDPDPHDVAGPSPNPAGDTDPAVLCDALQEHNVRAAVVRYESCGDSRSVPEVRHSPAGSLLPAWIEDRLCEVAEGYCPDGYETNDGGYGSLTLCRSQ